MTPRNRTHNALVSAAFIYGQFLVALGAAFFVTPLVLHTLGSRPYGLWLSSGELVGYFLLLDFGVFSILPWLIAAADGRRDPTEVKRLLANGLAVALALMLILLLLAAALLGRVPVVLHLTPPEWRALAGPLVLLVTLLAVNLPLNIFTPLLSGLQDVRFTGVFGLLKGLLGPALTVGLLLAGDKFYALAVGAATFSPLYGTVAFFRTRRIAPELLHGWPRPTWPGTAKLFREGIGAWLSGAGVQLMERSSAVVLTFLGSPATVPVLVCTSRVSQMLTQLTWALPDSALIGLAQLGGENQQARLREVMLSILRLHLIVSCLMACVVLALNPAFVRIWVGEKFFGGLLLNLLLAVEVVSASFVHGLLTVVGVQSHRLSIGLATLWQGTVYLALALTLTRRFSLPGLLTADLVAPMLSTLPLSLWLLRSAYGLSLRRIGREFGAIVVLRAGPCLLPAWAYGCWRAQNASLLELAAVGLLVTFVYLRIMGSQLSAYPLPAVAKTWLRRLRLV